MVRVALFVIACFSLFPSPASAQRIDPVKLRKAVRMPSVFIGFNLSWNSLFDNSVNSLFRRPSPAPQENWEDAIKEFRDDPERTYRVAGDWHSTRPEQAKAMLLSAKVLLEARRKESPMEGWWFALSGLVESALQAEDSATWLEKSVKLSPMDARCWSAMGSFRRHEEMGKLTKGLATYMLSEAEAEDKEKELQIAFAQAWAGFEAARKCHDRAIELDPRNPLYVRDRVQHTAGKCLNGIFGLCMAKFAPDDYAVEFRRLLADLERLSRFFPDEEALWISRWSVRMMVADKAENPSTKNGPLTAKQKELLPFKEEIQALSRLAKQTNSERAIQSAYYLAVIHFALDDPAKAAEILDSALQRSPDHQKASELRELLFTKSKATDQARRLSMKRLAKNRSPRNLYLFASKHAETEESEILLREALHLNPRHLPSLLGMTVLYLQKSAHPMCLDQACGYLRKAEDVVKEWQAIPMEQREARQADFDHDKCIEHSLKVYPAIVAAQRGDTLIPWITLRDLQREYPKDEELKELLAAFE